jgi:hypothetical protein
VSPIGWYAGITISCIIISLSTEMNEQPVVYLDGYLHSLRRFSGNRCDYWAEVIEIDDNFEDCFKVQETHQICLR